MNYVPFLEWATLMLDNFERIPLEIKTELIFLQDLELFNELERWKSNNICNRKYTSFRNVFGKKRRQKKSSG